MYLVDTDVISEIRKGEKASSGVRAFFESASRDGVDLYLSVVSVGELRQGVERIRHRGDREQAQLLERWLEEVSRAYADAILAIDEDTAHSRGRLRVPIPDTPLDNHI